MDTYTQGQWPSWNYSNSSESFPSSYHGLSQYPGHLVESMEAAYRSQQQHYAQQQQTGRITESKPRLSKDEVDILEAEFQRNHKPSTNTKKALAESMRVDDARINNWFQNRRAREKKERNIREYEARQKSEGGNQNPAESTESLRRKRDLVPSSAPFPGTRGASQGGSRHDRSSSGLNTDTDSDTASTGAVNSSGASPNLECVRLQSSRLSGVRQQSKIDSRYFDLAGANSVPRLVSPTYEYPTLCNTTEDDMDLASPDSMDSAGHNRRPPPLTISGSRSFPSALPKTTVEFNRRRTADVSLRRISSNGYPNRVQKLPHPPLSPFFDRRADTLYYLNRSPSSNGSASTMTPPTPETPAVVGQTSRESNFLGKYGYADASLSDPNLKTPPATPGIMENMMDLNGISRMVASEDDLVNRYGGDLQHTSAPSSLPGYMSSASIRGGHSDNSCHLGPNYFGYSGGNAEYNWSETSPSEHSSPGRGATDTNYMQSTTSQYPY